MSSEEGVPVDLYIYDLTNGLASVLSPAILGNHILFYNVKLGLLACCYNFLHFFIVVQN